MIATSLTTTAHQAARRARPAAVAVTRGRCSPPTRSRPGTPRRSTALAGVVMVLVAMLVRRANVRRLVYVLAVLVVVLVCLDRVYLGRHYPSDVIGGVLLGAFFVLLGIAVYSPLPAQPRRERRAAARGVPRPSASSRWSSTRSRWRTSGSSARSWPRWPRRPAGRRRPGTTRPSRTPAPAWPRRPPSPAPTWCWSAAATAPSARCAPSWPAPASRSASSRPAPATCWRATSASRSTSARPSTSRSAARTRRSTWSRSAATASRTPTSW